MDAAATLMTFASLRQSVVHWIRRNLPRAIVMSAVSFVFGWVANVVLLAVRYEGFDVAKGSKQLATGEGAMLAGTMFWAAASSLFFALFSYTRKVGLAKVVADVRSLPTVVKASLAGPEKDRTIATIAWGAAISLLAAIVIGPGAAGIVAVGLAVFATTPLSQIVAGVVRRLWMAILFRFSPTAGAPLDGVPGAIATAVGTASGMAVAFVFTSLTVKLALAAVAIAAAWLLVGRQSPPAAATVILGVVGGLFVLELLEAARAFADDGGWRECGTCSPIDWITSDGAAEVVARSTVGATAAGVGAPIGSAVGEILAGGGSDLGNPGGPDDPGQPDGDPEPPTDPGEADDGREAAWDDPTTDESGLTSDQPGADGEPAPDGDGPDVPPKPREAPPKPTSRPPGAGPDLAGTDGAGSDPVATDDAASDPVATDPVATDDLAASATDVSDPTASPGGAVVTGAEVAQEPPAAETPAKEGEPGWTQWVQGHVNAVRDHLESDPEEANTWAGWIRNTVVGTVANVANEVADLPNQVVDAVVAGAELGAKVVDEIQDPENWDVIYEGTSDTVADVVGLVVPGENTDGAYDKVVDGLRWAHDRVEDVGTIVGTLAAAAENDPAGAAVKVVETVLNKDNWDKAMDPDVPLLERTGRAVWGAIDNTMTIVGIGGAGVAALDKAGDMVRGAQALDKGADAARATGMLDDLGRAAASGADEAGLIAGKADDVARVAAGKTDDVARATGKTDDVAAVAGKTDEAAATARREPRTHKEAAEQRIADLKEGDIVDGNFITDTGYTGKQVNGDGKLVKITRSDGTEAMVREKMGINDITNKHNAVAETRVTNFDSMKRVRDGEGVPKDLGIKPKTIGGDDVPLGFNADDKGLVGYKQPRRPNPADFDDPAEFKRVQERFTKRDIEYRENSMDMFKLEQEGKVFVDRKTGVVFDVKTGKPYAGDIDAVVFRVKNADGSIGPPVSREKYLEIMDDWTNPANAVMGQHGAEAQVINDLTARFGRGTPEFNAALDKAIKLQGKLEDAHKTEQVIQFSGGVARKGPDYYGRLPADVTPEVQAAIDAGRAARRAAGGA